MDSVPNEISRPRLERVLRQQRRRLTTVVAGAGFGKSTLLHATAGDDWAIHSLTPGDRSLPLLARGLDRRLRARIPALSPDVGLSAAYGHAEDAAVTDGYPSALAATLAQDLDDSLRRPFVIALDDLHELDDGGDSIRFVEALCRNAPPLVHIVLASRRPIPFPLARLRLATDVVELTAHHLAFTVAELAELLDRRSSSSSDAATVHRRTGGWPAAVTFLLHGARRSDPTAWTGEDLASYLSEEVLRGAPLRTLKALVALPWWTPELLARLDPEVLAPADVAELARLGVLVPGAHAPGASMVMPVVRECLAGLDEPTDAAVRRVLTDAVPGFVAHHAWFEALDCAARSGDTAVAVELIEAHGSQLVGAGLGARVADVIAGAGHPPSLALLDAEIALVAGEWDKVGERIAAIAPLDQPLPARAAWRLGFAHHMRGDLTGALEVYRRGIVDGADPADAAALAGWQAGAHFLRGESDDAERLARSSLEIAQAAGDDRSLATAHTVLAMVAALRGDRTANDHHYLQALEHADRAGDVLALIRIRTNRGSRFMEEGALDAALVETDLALRLADMTGFALWRGMALTNRGEIQLLSGELDGAIGDLHQARAIFDRLGSRMVAYPLVQLGRVHVARGDTATARAVFGEAIELAESQDDRQVLVPALSGLARLVAVDDVAAARALVARALAVDAVVSLPVAHLAAAHVEQLAGRLDDARAAVDESIRIARGRRDRVTLAEALELAAALADDPQTAARRRTEASSLWRAIGSPLGVARVELADARAVGGSAAAARTAMVAEQLERLGAKALASEASVAADPPAAPPEVRVKVLGRFEVEVDGRPVPAAAWQSRVARELLAMLVAHRPRPLRRAELVDHFWPDDDSARASNRLSVALSTIRRVLDPDRAHGTDHHLDADRNTVRLNSVSVDADEFVALAEEGDRALRDGGGAAAHHVLQRAESLYVGDYLEEYAFSDWAVPAREHLRSLYLGVAAELAAAAERRGDHAAAIRQYLRILERDRFDERAHLGVIRGLDAQGAHGTARRMYGLYSSRMAELDIEPAPYPMVPE